LRPASPRVYNDMVKRAAPLFALLAALAVGLAAAPAPQKKVNPKDLLPEFRKWLQEDVVYIITPKERDVFLQLEADRERSMFIEAFWKQRDPNPANAENEFKTEHYRRLAYANQNFGRDAPGPGWRSDMGRIYITLGEPKQIDKFENMAELFPIQVWFYEGMAEFGLPNAFNVVFFKRNGIGVYELYSPVRDGPQNLLTQYTGDMTNYETAYSQLMRIEPLIADVSISLVPGESTIGISPSMSNEILLRSKIPAAPRVKVRDEYAEKLLKYKGVIDVDYTSNYIDNDALIRVFRDDAGPAFVHYLIEPKKLSFEERQGGAFHAEIEVNGKVADASGRTIYQFDRKAPIDMTRDQIAKISSKLFSYQDLFPLIPGQYTINLLWKNTVSREFTSVEANLLVPGPTDFAMSEPVTAHRIDRASPYRGTNKPFLVGGVQLVPSPRNDFQAGETLYLHFQLRNVPSELLSAGSVSFDIFRGEEKIQSLTRTFREIPDPAAILEVFPLGNLTSAYYRIHVGVRDASGQERVAADTPFYISPVAALPRPWVMSLPLPGPNDPAFDNIVGNQYFNAGDMAKARPLLESAARRRPEAAGYVLDYARLLAKAGEPAAVLEAVGPFLGDERRFDFLQLAGEASAALGQHEQAVARFKEYLAHFGASIAVLNAVGESSLALGDKAAALVAWEKSLELDPNQPHLKERVKTLKET
jgi:GWxTD domain-containing protein